MSVRDNQSMVVMLFGDRVKSDDISVSQAPRPVEAYRDVVFGLLDELGCGLAL